MFQKGLLENKENVFFSVESYNTLIFPLQRESWQITQLHAPRAHLRLCAKLNSGVNNEHFYAFPHSPEQNLKNWGANRRHLHFSDLEQPERLMQNSRFWVLCACVLVNWFWNIKCWWFGHFSTHFHHSSLCYSRFTSPASPFWLYNFYLREIDKYREIENTSNATSSSGFNHSSSFGCSIWTALQRLLQKPQKPS